MAYKNQNYMTNKKIKELVDKNQKGYSEEAIEEPPVNDNDNQSTPSNSNQSEEPPVNDNDNQSEEPPAENTNPE